MIEHSEILTVLIQGFMINCIIWAVIIAIRRIKKDMLKKYMVNIHGDIESYNKTVMAKNDKHAILMTRQELRKNEDKRADWDMDAIALRG